MSDIGKADSGTNIGVSWTTPGDVSVADRGVVSRETTTVEVSRETPLRERFPRPPTPRVLTVANQKGGVGKTTSTVNLAVALAQGGLNVIAIDLDPQGNASTGFGVEHGPDVPSIYDVVVGGDKLSDVLVVSPEAERLRVAPATVHLAGAEVELVPLVARENRLRKALRSFIQSESDGVDYVLIDCPPSLGLLTVNAFVAAQEVLIPIQCEYYALEGLEQLTTNVELIRAHLNPDLEMSTILLTMYDARTRLAEQVAQEVRRVFTTKVLDAVIPRSVRLSEAPGYGQSVLSYDGGSRGAVAYRAAAAEIAARGVAQPESTSPSNDSSDSGAGGRAR
jgi:chromosome partitioning protein